MRNIVNDVLTVGIINWLNSKISISMSWRENNYFFVVSQVFISSDSCLIHFPLLVFQRGRSFKCDLYYNFLEAVIDVFFVIPSTHDKPLLYAFINLASMIFKNSGAYTVHTCRISSHLQSFTSGMWKEKFHPSIWTFRLVYEPVSQEKNKNNKCTKNINYIRAPKII